MNKLPEESETLYFMYLLEPDPTSTHIAEIGVYEIWNDQLAGWIHQRQWAFLFAKVAGVDHIHR